MTDSSALLQAAWAVILAAVGAAALFGAGAAPGLRHVRRWVPTTFATLFFVGLTQFPLPDLGPLAWTCPRPSTAPDWTLFSFVTEILRRAEVVGIGPALASGRLALGSAMNLLIPGLIGMALACRDLRARTAVAFGFALSLGVEVTQLTGVWGVYPCAYRQFDVNDIMLNTLGTALGFWGARRVTGGGASRRPDRRSVSSRAP